VELGHGVFGEVAALGDGPFVVGLDEHGGWRSRRRAASAADAGSSTNYEHVSMARVRF
jgi:hypothetical protein